MPKEQVADAKRMVKKSSPRRRARPAPVREPPVETSRASLEVMDGATDWRFHLATFLRVSDNLVSSAVAMYDRVFGLDTREEGEIHFELGRKLADEERLDEATAALRRALRAKPDHKEALRELGAIHLRRDAPLAAIEVLRKARAAGLEDRKLHVLLADALCREGKFEDALEEIDCALAMSSDLPDLHYRRAVLLDHLERNAEAVKSFEKAIRLAPREVRYHQSLGFTLETMGRRAEAIRCFKRALELERVSELGAEMEHG